MKPQTRKGGIFRSPVSNNFRSHLLKSFENNETKPNTLQHNHQRHHTVLSLCQNQQNKTYMYDSDAGQLRLRS